jgi:hypothetical protein
MTKQISAKQPGKTEAPPVPIVPVVAALIVGAADWALLGYLAEAREVWDNPSFWRFGLPILLIAAFVLGVIWPERSWRWALALICGVILWSSGSAVFINGVPTLVPLGFLAFLTLGLPCMAVAYVGSVLAGRRKAA